MATFQASPVEGPRDDGSSRGKLLFDLAGIDLTRRVIDRAALEQWNPHRGQMALLDGIVWSSEDYSRGVATKTLRRDEFWVSGHFPGRPILPGVIMIEAGAQLSCYLFNVRRPKPEVVAFLRIEQASFRSMVTVGDELIILSQEVKFGRRHFVSDVQGIVGDRLAFDARISGMALSGARGRVAAEE